LIAGSWRQGFDEADQYAVQMPVLVVTRGSPCKVVALVASTTTATIGHASAIPPRQLSMIRRIGDLRSITKDPRDHQNAAEKCGNGDENGEELHASSVE